MAPFFTNYEYHYIIGIKPSTMIDKTAITQRSKLHIEDVDKFANKINKLHHFFYKKIMYTQPIQEDYANRKQILTLNYKVEDYIFVDAKNLHFKRLFKKLDFKSYGLYLIDKIISLYVYRLLLPSDSNTHSVFHINNLCLAPDNLLPG